MNSLPGYTDSFIDPVTGVLASANSLPNLSLGKAWLGDDIGRPQQSPEILDIKIDLRSIFDTPLLLSQTNSLFKNASVIDNLDVLKHAHKARHIVQSAHEHLPNAQALDTLIAHPNSLIKIIKAEDDGSVSVAVPDVDYATVATLEAIKNQAQAYANQAATSASQAASSATAAATSATASEASSLASAASAAAAEASASAASASALGAAASAIEAAASATNAQTYATQAQNYANQAQASANAAALSATNAATSATQAAASAIAAKASEDAAKISENNAKTSEDNAASSATSASASAVAAAASAAAAEAAGVASIISSLIGALSGGSGTTPDSEKLADELKILLGEKFVTLDGVVTGTGAIKDPITTSFADNPIFNGSVTINNGSLSITNGSLSVSQSISCVSIAVNNEGTFNIIKTNALAPLDVNFPLNLAANTSVNTTGFLKLPVGTSWQRPATQNGMIRYNTDISDVEIASNGQWLPLNETIYINQLPINGNLDLQGYNLITSGDGLFRNVIATGYGDFGGGVRTNTITAKSGSTVTIDAAANINENLTTYAPALITTASSQSGLTINNDDSYSNANGLIVKKSNNDSYSCQFGFNNNTNEGYVWSSHNLKFGSYFSKRLELTNNRMNTSLPIYYDNSNETNLMYFNSSAHQTYWVMNNNYAASPAHGIEIQKLGATAVEFGYSNRDNIGYVWSATGLEFGTGDTRRMTIASNSADISCYDTNHQLDIRTYGSYYNLNNTFVFQNRPSAIIEMGDGNNFGETASIAMNGDFIQVCGTFDNYGIIFSDSDLNTQNTFLSYIDSLGKLKQNSSEARKYSIHKKEKIGYLDRINQLNIYSYAYKYPIDKNDKEKTKNRKYYKNLKMQVGFIAEEVESIFDNAVNKPKLINISSEYNNTEDFNNLVNGHTPSITTDDFLENQQPKTPMLSIDYDVLLCYTVLALQELTKKFENLENKIKQSGVTI